MNGAPTQSLHLTGKKHYICMLHFVVKQPKKVFESVHQILNLDKIYRFKKAVVHDVRFHIVFFERKPM